jgi:hypothetical protein
MSAPTNRQAQARWWRPAWYELLPELVLGAGLALFLMDEPDAATSAFRSSRAVALMAASAVVWLVGRIVIARLVSWRLARTAVFGLAAIGALAVVVVPAYRNETVVEAFPGTPSRPLLEDTAATIATTAVSPITTAHAEPVRLRSGPFTGIDHRASGTVSVYRTPDEQHVVGLEEFAIQPGPDYDVYVVPGSNRADRDGGVRLDDLRGNRGTQYYEVPAGIDVGNGDWTVLIWCQTFGVPVANATPV